MYCKCRAQAARNPCCCQYQRPIISCRCHQRCCSCRCDKEEEKKPEEKKEVKVEPTPPPIIEIKKEPKKSKWPFWRGVNCHDGKLRFLKTNKCPIPRRGYSLQRNPNCRCNKDAIFEPFAEFVYQKPTKQTASNKKNQSSTDEKKTENNSKTKESNEKDTKNSKKSKSKDDDNYKHEKKRRERNHSRRKAICCCSNQAPTYRPACCCQNAHTSTCRFACQRCRRPVIENVCCKCKRAELAKLCKKTSYDCVKSYTKSGDSKFVCKKKKRPPCENTEEYALLLENGTLNPCDGPTQIIIVADPKCNDNPAIELLPIDPFTPVPPCECNGKQRQNDPPTRRNSQNPRSSFDAENKSARPSLEYSKKSVDTSRRSSLETDKKKKKK